MADRLLCAVPGCRRTHKAGEFDEWVCGKHWSAVPRDLRRLYTVAKRRWRRDPAKWGRVCSRLWERCREAAIDRAMGIR